ncbi:DUF1684 domain-containing protein [Eudoraea chungangensis]|uniref:DUF1684 domain-containing protein n=1 Tax=Eudoraea chungangensis TaxID=1481905 RepID=UPI0023EBCDFF|nr:DUF1684 domain-containing protein [Eudoraea chungangensis]
MKKGIGVIWLLIVVVFSSCGDKRRYHDEAKEQEVSLYPAQIKEIVKFQQNLNKTFKDPNLSPLPDRFRKDFDGLDFFKPDTQFIVQGILKRTPNAIPFMMPTNTERFSEETVYGIIEFRLQNKAYSLEVYQNVQLRDSIGFRDYLFLPFLDKTNGVESYEGGRYLDLSIPEGDAITLDFNKAYNPYCVYNKKYSCPIVPKENYLNTEIKAGVKRFDKTNK